MASVLRVERVHTLGIFMKQEEYEQIRKLTLEFVNRLKDDPEMVEALKNCPDNIAAPIVMGIFEEQVKSSILSVTSMKMAAIASMIALISMVITAISLAFVSENVFLGVAVIILVAILYIAIKKINNMGDLGIKKPDHKHMTEQLEQWEDLKAN